MSEQTFHSSCKKTDYAAFENFLFTKFERLTKAPKAVSYPYVVNVDPSSTCQLRCPSCFTGVLNDARRKKLDVSKYVRSSAQFDIEMFNRLMDEFGDLVFYMNFYNWGEPLLNKNIADFVQVAHDRGIFTKIDTNLSLQLTDAFLEKLLLSGIDSLAVSIDGFSQETYEKYRVGGRLSLVLDNLERLVLFRDRLGLDTDIIWNMLVFSFNEHEIPKMKEFCNERRIKFNPRDAKLTSRQEDWTPSYRREGRPNPYRDAPAIAQLTTPAGRVRRDLGRPDGGRTCGWHYSYTSINSDGSVQPCCALFTQEVDFGKLSEESDAFRQVWNNSNYSNVRTKFPQEEEGKHALPQGVCLNCKYSTEMMNHFNSLDLNILGKYWSLDEASPTRRLDRFFLLLQTSPSDFVEAFAPVYDTRRQSGLTDVPSAGDRLAGRSTTDAATA